MHRHPIDLFDAPLVVEDADACRDGPVASQVVDEFADGVAGRNNVVFHGSFI